MRYHEIASGLRLPVSSEEQKILDRVADGVTEKSEFDEREQEVARQMVNRGVLTRLRDKAGKIVFRASSVKDIWRER